MYQPFHLLCLAFPHNNDLPAKLLQFPLVAFVPFHGALEFLLPEILSALWGVGVLAVFVSVPVTTVDEDNGSVFWQDDIRLSRQVFSMETKAIAQAMER